MSDKMMGEMKSRLREIMKGKPVGSPNSKEIEDMIVQVGEDMGVFKKTKPKKMKEGGAVPAEFKGFSKLPEPVQVKMNPDLAQKYENGGEVRGARSAISGRGFKGIR